MKYSRCALYWTSFKSSSVSFSLPVSIFFQFYFHFLCFFQAFYNQRAPSNEATSASLGPKGGQQPPLRGYNLGIQLQSQSDKGKDNHLKMWRKKPTRALGGNQRYIKRPRDHHFHIMPYSITYANNSLVNNIFTLI